VNRLGYSERKCAHLLESSTACFPGHSSLVPNVIDASNFRFRVAIYSQVLLAAGCMFSFEKYLRTCCHPLGWEEAALRSASTVALVIFGWLIAESLMARHPLWHRVLRLVASGALILADGSCTRHILRR
jgi:hypothetical protein